MSVPRPDLSAATWRKSSYSANGGDNCLEVAEDFPGVMPVRDSKAPDRAPLCFQASKWAEFVAAVKLGAVS